MDKHAEKDLGLNEVIEKLENEINERKRVETALRASLENTLKREAEISALLDGSRAILENRDFPNAARRIFDSCKKLIGATAGYVALLDAEGKENKVLFLDAGGLPCSVDQNLPMPVRGLRGEVYHHLKAAYENDFSRSEWMKFMPPGHACLQNVLFAPLVINGKPVGLLGLANKTGGFNENDARLATAFGEFAAIALFNNWTLDMLAKSEERFHKVVETARDAIISFDVSGKIISWNRGAEAVFGYLPDEITGKDISILIPDQLCDEFTAGFREMAINGNSVLFGKALEFTATRKHGKEFPVELSLTAWKIKEGTFLTVIIRDITERRKAIEAVRRLNEELKQRTLELEAANKGLESFSYSVSHDLRAPLQVISGYLELLGEERDLGDEGRHLLKVVNESTWKMEKLIDSILVFSRMGRKSLSPSQIDIGELAQEVFGEMSVAITGREIKFIVNPMPAAWADPSMVRIVLTNLFSNALKFTSKKDTSLIEIGGAEAGGQASYYIRDNGIGFDMSQADKIFNVFQRLQSDFEGTGIGLATVRNIITKHDGRVWAESKPGEGATFHFTLPLTASSSNIIEELKKTGT